MTRRSAAYYSAFILAFLATRFCYAEPASPPSVVLLDVSGSMEQEGGIRFARYSSGQVRNLLQHLGAAMAASASGPVYVQPFSSSHNPVGEIGPMDATTIEAAAPQTAHAPETELDYALRVGLQRGPDVFVYLLTDNKNDYSGSRSDHQFYEMLANERNIHSVFFVPLAQPGNKTDALVLYGIAAGKASRETLRRVVSTFASKVQSEAVQFRPLYEQDKQSPQLGLSHDVQFVRDTGEEQPANSEGDATVVLYDEGRSLDGELKFRIHSNLKHWRIIDGELQKAEASAEVPDAFAGAGEINIPVSIRGGGKLNVSPGGDSIEIYSLPLTAIADAGVTIRRRSLFQTKLPDLPVRLRLRAVVRLSQKPKTSGLQRLFSPDLERKIEAVNSLPEIMNVMTFQADAIGGDTMERVIPITRDVLLRVKPNILKNLAAQFLMIGLPLIVVVVLAVILLVSRPANYVLIEPFNRVRPLSFTRTRSTADVYYEGRKCATLEKLNHGFRVRPERGFEVNPYSIWNNTSEF